MQLPVLVLPRFGPEFSVAPGPNLLIGSGFGQYLVNANGFGLVRTRSNLTQLVHSNLDSPLACWHLPGLICTHRYSHCTYLDLFVFRVVHTTSRTCLFVFACTCFNLPVLICFKLLVLRYACLPELATCTCLYSFAPAWTRLCLPGPTRTCLEWIALDFTRLYPLALAWTRVRSNGTKSILNGYLSTRYPC
jgi:hypothetical protein